MSSSGRHDRSRTEPGQAAPPFWKTRTLAEMSVAEWESLCDGCGRCCLIKLEDADTAEVHYTDVACRLLDLGTCRCGDYANRQVRVPDCIALTHKALSQLTWMPSTCAYRLLHEGSDLPWWHPLVSGDPATVVEAGISVRGRAVGEGSVAEKDLPTRMVDWPV